MSGSLAWVIDGATGLSDEQVTPGGSDAAWLAGLVGDSLTGLAGDGNPDAILRHLEYEIDTAFRAITTHVPPVDDHHAPSACLGLIEARTGRDGQVAIHGRFLGDVIALIPTEQGIVRWSDERAKPFERKTLAALGAREHAPGSIPEVVRRQILENRGRLNRPDGYWVVNPLRPWAGQELRFDAQVGSGEPIVLATDGFMRLVDVFEAYSDRTLHAELAAGRGADLLQELRDRERSDLMAGLYPRVKTHDDATFLVVAAEPYG
ncbi:hypothetical protein HPT29_007220 [Microvirga terrae]|uniref:Protein phosphatase 2C domain-containing protein n=1 Tax=Microvirga terrae TaxID=2740529 RepID=A0ABY5RVE2_9HYPH|nr:hypothetical protein [Microvirga terrae]UVF20909.1 hypothetical protein HPT29_007220 [Microvirga terrae]